MRQYLYTLEVDRGRFHAIELFILYAVDDEDAHKKARKRVKEPSHAQLTLKRGESYYIAAHIVYPPYIDMEDAKA